MLSLICIIAFAFYSFLVFVVKWILCPKLVESPSIPMRWNVGHVCAFVFTPDLFWAKWFKKLIAKFSPFNNPCFRLRQYVLANNCRNVIFTVIVTAIVFILYAKAQRSVVFQFFQAVAVIRFISRSFEIIYAFGRDVIDKEENTTGLNKFQRVKLALISYAEIFIFSAGAYLVLPSVCDPLDAITTSLNVGTLTNVGFAFPTPPDSSGLVWWRNMVFIQVFATLSLVVLSLASYLSRNK